MINHHAGVVAPLRRLTRRRVCWIETAIACLAISQGLAAGIPPAKPSAPAYAKLTNKEPNASQALPGLLSAIKAEQPGEEKRLAAGIGDPVVLSLFAAGNPSFLATDAEKHRFLRHLNEAVRTANP